MLTRRRLLGAAAGGAAALGYAALPAWARPIATAAGLRRPDSLPFPHRRAGEPDPALDRIEHVVVLMMENHSFDNLLGMVPHQVPGRAAVDGFTLKRGEPVNSNPQPGGPRLFARPMSSPCQLDGEPTQAWNASHQSYDNGRNDGFVAASGPVAMRFWDETDLPFTYSMVKHFPMGERYFCSVLAQTYPNRRFLFTGTASGLTATNNQTFTTPAANGTIFDRLDAHHIDWRNYYQNAASALIVPGLLHPGARQGLKPMTQFFADAAAGKLPPFTLLDPQYTTTSEENPQDIQVGEEFVAKVVKALMHAPTWKNTALFLTYDEHGGYYDHVPPPRGDRARQHRPHPGPRGAAAGPRRL